MIIPTKHTLCVHLEADNLSEVAPGTLLQAGPTSDV